MSLNRPFLSRFCWILAILACTDSPSWAQSEEFEFWFSGRADSQEGCYARGRVDNRLGTIWFTIAHFDGDASPVVSIETDFRLDQSIPPLAIIDGVSYQSERVGRDGEGSFAVFGAGQRERLIQDMREGRSMTVRLTSNRREQTAIFNLIGVTAATNHMNQVCVQSH